MAAVLRAAARRLAGELPAAEMALHRLPLHSEVSVWSPSSGRGLLPSAPAPAPSLSKGMESAIRPPFIPRLTAATSSSPSLDKTKAVIKSPLLPPFIPRRTMSTSSASQPPGKAKAVIQSALLPPFVPRRTMSSSSGRATSEPADKAKAVIKSALLPPFIPRRTMSTSSTPQTPDKFWLEIVGHRMKGPQNPCPMIFRKRISGVDADHAEAVFMDVMMKAKYDGKVPPNMMSGPVRAFLRKALMRYMKFKWFIKESALTLKLRCVFKLGKLNFVVICVVLYMTYGRPLSLLRRFWKILKSQGGNDSE